MRFFVLASIVALAAGCSASTDDGPTTAPPAAVPPAVTPPPAGPPPPPPCSGTVGTFHDQAFESGGETRHYWLHVPSSYACATAAPLVVDFHGTGFGSATDTVEESWATPDLESASDDLGFIVLRPRSRPTPSQGGFVYQWDLNPGDVVKNKAFALALVADLVTRYHVDPARIYATGFSNGPSMAAQFLADDPPTFHGFGLISGGLNAPLNRTTKFGADAPRVYTMTGYRDYMRVAWDNLESFLDKHEHPKTARFDREADTGHEVYGWHFREAFAWMDAGKRPDPGSLRAPWALETTGTDESFVEMTQHPDGHFVAVGAKGGIYSRAPNGAWTKTTAVLASPLSDVCFLPDGRGFAVGHGHLVGTTDGTTWNAMNDVPEFGAQQFGYTYATSIACAGTRVIAGGVWSSATSIDGGKNWSAVDAGGSGDPAFVTAIRPSADGSAWLGLGYYDFVGRSGDGVAFVAQSHADAIQWWNDGALSSASGVIVGEAGNVRTSAGADWSAASVPTKEDLYAVAQRGAKIVAVGAHGAAIVSVDGGKTWTDRATGLDGFLGAVKFLDDATALVVGEKGVAAKLSL